MENPATNLDDLLQVAIKKIGALCASLSPLESLWTTCNKLEFIVYCDMDVSFNHMNLYAWMQIYAPEKSKKISQLIIKLREAAEAETQRQLGHATQFRIARVIALREIQATLDSINRPEPEPETPGPNDHQDIGPF